MKQTVPLLLGCTALIAVAGFLLPGFLSEVQDRKTQTKTEVYETDRIQFHPVTQMKDSLQLLKGFSYPSDFFQKSGEKRNSDKAYEAALEALRFLQKNNAPGVMPNGSFAHTEMPLLVISSDKTRSAILWQCEFRRSKGGDRVHLLIDDTSGKMLAFKVVSKHPITAEKEETFNEKTFAKRLSKIASLYFGWKIKAVETIQTESSLKGEITLTDSFGNPCTFPYLAADDTYTFNNTEIVFKILG